MASGRCQGYGGPSPRPAYRPEGQDRGRRRDRQRQVHRTGDPLMRALILAAAVAAFAFAPISAAVAGPLKGLPPVQTVGVKVPLKLIQVSTGGYDDPGEPAEDVDCTC